MRTIYVTGDLGDLVALVPLLPVFVVVGFLVVFLAAGLALNLLLHIPGPVGRWAARVLDVDPPRWED